MLQPVAVAHKTLSDYTHIVGRELIAEIRELAEPLEGKRVVHVSATAFGGGVSEILYTLVPLMREGANIGLGFDGSAVPLGLVDGAVAALLQPYERTTLVA